MKMKSLTGTLKYLNHIFLKNNKKSSFIILCIQFLLMITFSVWKTWYACGKKILRSVWKSTGLEINVMDAHDKSKCLPDNSCCKDSKEKLQSGSLLEPRERWL